MRKINWGLLATGFLMIIVALCVMMMFLSFNEFVDAHQKISCANYFIKEATTYNNFYHVCGDENCKLYFKDKMIQYLKMAEECFKDV